MNVYKEARAKTTPSGLSVIEQETECRVRLCMYIYIYWIETSVTDKGEGTAAEGKAALFLFRHPKCDLLFGWRPNTAPSFSCLAYVPLDRMADRLGR